MTTQSPYLRHRFSGKTSSSSRCRRSTSTHSKLLWPSMQEQDSSRTRTKHVATAHKTDPRATTLADSSLEDGDSKIFCLKGYTLDFTTYITAVQHAKLMAVYSEGQRAWISCLWKPIRGCEPERIEAKALADDSRGPSRCSKRCSQYHADLYMLAAHEENCEGICSLAREITFAIRLQKRRKRCLHPQSLLEAALASHLLQVGSRRSQH